MVAALAAEGATVIAADVEPPDPSLWADLAGRVVPAAFDIADAKAVHESIAAAGPVDILVNNAGVFDVISSVTRVTDEQWERDLRINLSGPFYAVHAVLPHMIAQRWGRIINISSMSSGGAYKQVTYGATKTGLIGLTRAVASEYAPVGITSNAVLPGLIGTAKARTAPDDITAAALATIPAGRMGEPEEIAAMVAYLAGPAGAYVNGAAIPVDGGTMLLNLKFSRKLTFNRSGQPEDD
jgi:NAD(P)-dependent dehydrogenase (short-subunit alcohol dehydrogenase family)